jgi:uncharacterized membrane protein
MDPAPLIAIDVILLYTLLSPLVLFLIFVFFDGISTQPPPLKDETGNKKDPALWSARDIDEFLDGA